MTNQVARAPKSSPRNTTKPQVSPTPAEPSASSLTDLSPPESISGDDDSNGENAFDSLTFHATASSSTSADMLSADASSNMPHSITESQFTAVMPYMEDPGQTSSNVFLETLDTDPHTSQQILNPLIILRHLVLMPHHHNLLPQVEVPEAQKEHPLYVCEGYYQWY